MGRNPADLNKEDQMKRLLLGLILAGTIGCRGPKGDDAPGSITSLTGIIYSDDFTVTNEALTPNANVFVAVGDEIHFTELPYYLPALGVNATYVLTRGSVQILNAKAAGAYTYKITIVKLAPSHLGSKITEGI